MRQVTYRTGIEIYEQCEQIIRSYGPPCDEDMRAGLINIIRHFKTLYKRDYKPIKEKK